jgi:hypothetical protein
MTVVFSELRSNFNVLERKRQRILIPPCGGSNPPAPAN